ncbi:hypothetical protein Dimus_014556 [Dionaea muscipula]
MLVDRELSNSTSHGVESSETRLPQPDSGRNPGNPDAKVEFSQTALEYLRKSDVNYSGFGARHPDAGNSCSQELTLRYLCGNSKLGLSDNDFSPRGSLNFKGKGVILESSCQDERWVERDFLHLSENKGGSSKRELEDETERGREGKDKNPKIDPLKLSLALPNVSLCLTTSNAMQQNGDPAPPVRPEPSRSVQSLAPSADNVNTQTTYSNMAAAASLSYSHSHPFSHNPSCSLTRNSTDVNECSMGSHRKENDQVWNCGEGTNGSVHSRFRPIGDGVALLHNHGGGNGMLALMNGGGRSLNKDPVNSIYRAACSSDTSTFFPSELPAKPRLDTMSGDSRGRHHVDHLMRGSDNLEGRGFFHKASKPEKILQEICSESIPVMAQILEELPDETIESTKEYLKSLIAAATESKHDDLLSLQRQLDRRSDLLSRETLSKAHKVQLEILVATKFGLEDLLLSGKVEVPTGELVEIFLLMRCRNVSCKSMLPVDDCDCKICLGTKGFCSQCMCPVCMKFDCASNTCSWVGCDVCSHWCHAACGIEKNLIRPGPAPPTLKGPTEMQFHCLGCGHASEMFGFVKDVFKYCAKDWVLNTLIRELNCVTKIFKGSQDVRGKQLYLNAEETISRLARAAVSPSDARTFLIQFFNNAERTSNLPASGVKEEAAAAAAPGEAEAATIKETVPPLAPKSSTIFNTSSSSSPLHDLTRKDATVDGLEGIIQIKEAESRLFQKRADEARKEAEGYRRLVRTRMEKLEEDLYPQKLANLCLQETEERRRRKMEELKLLESSHCDYYNMKIRMQAEIAGLLERMETTKQLAMGLKRNAPFIP